MVNHPLVRHVDEGFDVYVGRPSKWGNPYVIGVHGTREEVIDKYRELVKIRDRLYGNYFYMIQNELRGKTLGCHCNPDDCHATVLAEIANEDIQT